MRLRVVCSSRDCRIDDDQRGEKLEAGDRQEGRRGAARGSRSGARIRTRAALALYMTGKIRRHGLLPTVDLTAVAQRRKHFVRRQGRHGGGITVLKEI